MATVNIAELKNRLSYYLRTARGGEPVLIRDRNQIIARIEAFSGSISSRNDEARRMADLERRGIVAPPRKAPWSPREARAHLRRGAKTDGDLLGALLAEREEDR